MSGTTGQTPAVADPTFRNYDRKQGAHYAEHRRGYSSKLYDTVIDYHVSNGSQLNTILDIGCGPGLAIRDLAPRFTHAIGLDPSDGMIATARSLGGASASGEPIRFDVSTAETLGAQLSPPVPDASVDLVIAATAAHWFDMADFWPAAARVLRPGGSVALWCPGPVRVGAPTPNADAVQAAFTRLEERTEDFFLPGNRLARSRYVGMPLPWTLEQPVAEFDEASYIRREYGTEESSEQLFDSFGDGVGPDVVEALTGTASPVVRWRKAHPEAVGTEKDVVRMMRREIERALREGGAEEGKEMMYGTITGVLIMAKKKAE